MEKIEPFTVLAEEDFADTTKPIKAFLTGRSPKPPCIPKEVEFAGLSQRPVKMPSWLTEEDVSYYAAKFGEKGFIGGLELLLYHGQDLGADWGTDRGRDQGAGQVRVAGDLDLTYHFPGVKQLLYEGSLKTFEPMLEEVVVMEYTGYFLQQEKPDQVTAHIHDCIKKF